MSQRRNVFPKGITQVELMITVALVSGALLVGISAFSTVARGVLVSKSKSLATNLSQEKIEILKDKSYYRLRVSSSPVLLTVPNPDVVTDPYNYPKEELYVGGMTFERYAFVEKVRKQVGTDDLETVPWDNPDTGLKRVIVTTVWQEGADWKQYKVINLRQNPDRAAANVEMTGTVLDALSNPLPGAIVEVVENPSWRDLAGASGDFSFGLSPGTYTLRASMEGYFSDIKVNRSVDVSNSPLSTNFNLSQMSSGSVSGSVWFNDHPVITRIVGSTVNSVTGFSQEYVEVFNPTTWTWTVDSEWGLRIQRRTVQGPKTEISLVYVTTFVAPGGFYLFSNTGTLTINGANISVDAFWENAVGGINDSNAELPHFDPSTAPQELNVIPVFEDGGSEGAAALELYLISTGQVLDQFGWKGSGTGLDPGFFEGSPFDHGQTQGLNQDETFLRFSSTAGYDSNFGPAYDSQDNDVDWEVFSGLTEFPRNSVNSTQTIISGVVAEGAYVFADDGLSSTVQTVQTGSPPYAAFTLTSIATGTWTLSASSSTRYTESSIVVTAGSSQDATVQLSSSTDSGYVSGIVKDSFGVGLQNITVNPGGVQTDALGNYRLVLSEGLQNIVANPGALNANYVETVTSVTVTVGQIVTGVDHTLANGGQVTGLITSDGTNPLPNIPVSIVDNFTSLEVANVSSDGLGSFVAQVPASTYNISPIPEFGEVVTPAAVNGLVVSGGATVFSSTFTVGSALGTILGTVYEGSELITTGVLIVATTGTISAGPPDVDAALRAGANVYYMASSSARGTYQVEAHSGVYNMYAWYTSFLGNSPVTIRKQLTGVTVSPGGTTTGHDFNW